MLAGTVVAIALAGQAAFSWIRPSLSEDSMVRSIVVENSIFATEI